jgi:hypothetical protein
MINSEETLQNKQLEVLLNEWEQELSLTEMRKELSDLKKQVEFLLMVMNIDKYGNDID